MGGKEKYKKYIINNLDEAQRVFFRAMPEDTAGVPVGAEVNGQEPQDREMAGNGEGHESDIEQFCRCKGEY